MKSRDRKWTLAKLTWGLCALIAGGAFFIWGAAALGWIEDAAGAPGVIMQGLGGIAGVLGLYGAANVAQKGVVGAHYRAELDDRKGRADE
jgi:hypothetical protein